MHEDVFPTILRAYIWRDRLIVVREAFDESRRGRFYSPFGPQLLDANGCWHHREEGWEFTDGDGIRLTETQRAGINTERGIKILGAHPQGSPIARLIMVRKSLGHDVEDELFIVEDVGFVDEVTP